MTPENDDAVIARAFDDPVVSTGLLGPSRSNELALQAVCWALANPGERWHRLMHGAGPPS